MNCSPRLGRIASHLDPDPDVAVSPRVATGQRVTLDPDPHERSTTFVSSATQPDQLAG